MRGSWDNTIFIKQSPASSAFLVGNLQPWGEHLAPLHLFRKQRFQQGWAHRYAVDVCERERARRGRKEGKRGESIFSALAKEEWKPRATKRIQSQIWIRKRNHKLNRNHKSKLQQWRLQKQIQTREHKFFVNVTVNPNMSTYT